MKRVFLLPFLFFPLFLFSSTGDSTHYLIPGDTVFLTIGDFHEKIFHHEIEEKQTLYSLARFYGLHVEELYHYNPIFRSQSISVGSKIKIPIPNRAIIRYRKAGFKAEEHVPVYYVVKKGDTFFNISARLFKMPIDTIMNRNQLVSEVLSVGQKLFIGWMSLNGIPESYRSFRGNPEWKKSQALRNNYALARTGRKEYNEQGVAFWQKNGHSNTDLYALHRSAPVNSVIAVTNPMKRRTVYAKVLGRISENVYGSDITVVISPKVAEFLGAKDPRFFVKVRYLK